MRFAAITNWLEMFNRSAGEARPEPSCSGLADYLRVARDLSIPPCALSAEWCAMLLAEPAMNIDRKTERSGVDCNTGAIAAAEPGTGDGMRDSSDRLV